MTEPQKPVSEIKEYLGRTDSLWESDPAQEGILRSACAVVKDICFKRGSGEQFLKGWLVSLRPLDAVDKRDSLHLIRSKQRREHSHRQNCWRSCSHRPRFTGEGPCPRRLVCVLMPQLLQGFLRQQQHEAATVRNCEDGGRDLRQVGEE